MLRNSILFLLLVLAFDAATAQAQAITKIGDVLGPQVYVAPEDQGRYVYNNTGASLVEGDVVYISSWSGAQSAWIVAKADADLPTKAGQYIVTATIFDANYGTVKKGFLSSATMNTGGATIGDPVYLSATAGGWTLTPPSGADQDIQILGRVAVVSATVGQIRFWFEDVPQKRGTSSLQDSAVTAAKIADGAIAAADLSASADIARSQLVTETSKVYGLPAGSIVSSAGAALTAAETAGTFDITVGTNTIVVNGEVTDNETEVSVAYFQFVLPPEYVSAGSVVIRLPCALIKAASPTDGGSTIDLEVYEQSDAGAVGADLCATAAQTFAAMDTWYTKDFTVTATGLVAGDVLNVKITSTVIDGEAGGGTIIFNLAPPKILLSIKG